MAAKGQTGDKLGVGEEWQLLKLSRVGIFLILEACEIMWFGKQWD